MRRLSTFLFAVLAGYLAMGAQAPAVGGGIYLAPPVAHAAVDTGVSESQFVEKINALRAQKGLSRLVVHAELVSVARSWAATMAQQDRISHNPDLADSVKADWVKLGENVGVGMTVESLMDAFIASPSHYKNLVEPSFTHVGVGVVLGKDDAIFTTHQFMTLRQPVATTSPPATQVRNTTTSVAPSTTAKAPRATAPPAPSAPPSTDPAPVPDVDSPPEATEAPPEPTARFVLVLQQLRALDA